MIKGLIIACIFILFIIESSVFLAMIAGEFGEDEDIMLDIRIKYIRDIKPIEIFLDGDWIDLRCAEDVELKAGESYIIPLGVAMELPRGYTAIIAPRSSTFKKWGVIQTNSIGIIDESYCGDNDEWGMPVLALRNTKIHKNDRICQFRLINKSDFINLQVVKTLGNKDREGFGSTGEN